MENLKNLFLTFSDESLDPIAKKLIQKWDEPEPTALQLLEALEALDACIHGSLSTGFIMASLQSLLGSRIKHEGTTLEALKKLATWRS